MRPSANGETKERKGRNVLLKGLAAIVRSFLAVFAGRRGKDAASDTAAIGAAATSTATAPVADAAAGKPQERKLMSSGFDMQAEIAKLAERIIEPVAAKLTAQERKQIVGRIRDAFEQFNLNRTTPDSSFENMAVRVLEPVRLSLTDAERKRCVDRLGGAMAAFCQGLGRVA
jgi:hypothetical protein